MVGQPAVRLLLQTQKVRNDPPAIGAGGFSYFVKVRMITYLLQRRNSLLLLRDLGCVAFGDIGFRTVFAAFRSGHGDNLFPFIVV
mgnify:CR=1 FL=1